jgi:hypothetical protein
MKSRVEVEAGGSSNWCGGRRSLDGRGGLRQAKAQRPERLFCFCVDTTAFGRWREVGRRRSAAESGAAVKRLGDKRERGAQRQTVRWEQKGAHSSGWAQGEVSWVEQLCSERGYPSSCQSCRRAARSQAQRRMTLVAGELAGRHARPLRFDASLAWALGGQPSCHLTGPGPAAY